MKKSLKWLASTSIAGFIAALCSDYVTKRPVLKTITEIWNFFINSFITFLNFGLKVWWLIVLAIVFLIIRFYYLRNRNRNDGAELRFLQYTADSFNFFIWKWNWVYNDLIKLWEIENLHPVCEDKKCRGELEYRRSSFKTVSPKYICKKCSTVYDARENSDAVARKIVDNVNRGNFRI